MTVPRRGEPRSLNRVPARASPPTRGSPPRNSRQAVQRGMILPVTSRPVPSRPGTRRRATNRRPATVAPETRRGGRNRRTQVSVPGMPRSQASPEANPARTRRGLSREVSQEAIRNRLKVPRRASLREWANAPKPRVSGRELVASRVAPRRPEKKGASKRPQEIPVTSAAGLPRRILAKHRVSRRVTSSLSRGAEKTPRDRQANAEAKRAAIPGPEARASRARRRVQDQVRGMAIVPCCQPTAGKAPMETGLGRVTQADRANLIRWKTLPLRPPTTCERRAT